jgi:predicted P-loop ATPase
MSPGTKFDCVPVLDGDQGIGKSSIVKDLVTSDYYSETLSLTDMDDKSGAEKLQGFWVVEIGELAGMKKADIEKVKAFLSTSDDKYRPSTARSWKATRDSASSSRPSTASADSARHHRKPAVLDHQMPSEETAESLGLR